MPILIPHPNYTRTRISLSTASDSRPLYASSISIHNAGMRWLGVASQIILQNSGNMHSIKYQGGENTKPRRVECLTAKYMPPIIITTKLKHVAAADVAVLANRQFLVLMLFSFFLAGHYWVVCQFLRALCVAGWFSPRCALRAS